MTIRPEYNLALAAYDAAWLALSEACAALSDIEDKLTDLTAAPTPERQAALDGETAASQGVDKAEKLLTDMHPQSAQELAALIRCLFHGTPPNMSHNFSEQECAALYAGALHVLSEQEAG